MDKTWKVILAFAGIFAAGGVTGGLLALRVANPDVGAVAIEAPAAVTAPQAAPTLVSTATAAAPTAQPAVVRPAMAQFNPPEQLGPQLFRRLTNQIGLTPEQRAKIRPIEMRATEELNRLRRDTTHSTQVLIDKNEDEIRAELTPEQTAKFDEMVGVQRQKIQKFVADQQRRQRDQKAKMFQQPGQGRTGNIIASPATPAVGEPKKQ